MRPIPDLWENRDQMKANYETLMQTTGIHGGSMKGDASYKALVKAKGH